MASTKLPQGGPSKAKAPVRNRVRGLADFPAARVEDSPANFRTHGPEQRAAMAGIFGAVGSVDELVVWIPDDAERERLRAMPGRAGFDAWLASFAGPVRLVNGHMRKRLRGRVLGCQVTDLDAREAALVLATFDPIGAQAGRDDALLRDLLGNVGRTETDADKLLDELRATLGDAPPAPDLDEEEEPVIPTDALVEKWGTASGQLWIVPSLVTPGRAHRLLCGDCRDPANVQRLHEGQRPALGLHDPPYGIDIVARGVGDGAAKATNIGHGGSIGDGAAVPLKFAGGGIGDGRKRDRAFVRRGKFAPIEGDRGPFDPQHLLDSDPAALVLWGANHYADRLPPSAGVVVWDKRAGAEQSENDFSDGELAWVSPKASGRLRIVRHLWNGLLRASEKSEQRMHPTQKPVAVQGQIVEWYSKRGDIVADWYMGAGAVLLACEKLGRIGHGMDIAPAYLAATLERFEQRGLKPERVE